MRPSFGRGAFYDDRTGFPLKWTGPVFLLLGKM